MKELICGDSEHGCRWLKASVLDTLREKEKTTLIYMGLALQGYYSISNSTECKQTELFLLSSTNESICMKDGFLILVKSLLGGGKGCGED